MDAVKNFNQPIKSTSTTTLKGNEGLDVGSLLMMLMMSGVFNKGKPTATNFPYSAVANSAENIVGDIRGSGAGEPLSAPISMPTGMGSSMTGTGGGLSSLLQILSKLGPLFTGQ